MLPPHFSRPSYTPNIHYMLRIASLRRSVNDKCILYIYIGEESGGGGGG